MIRRLLYWRRYRSFRLTMEAVRDRMIGGNWEAIKRLQQRVMALERIVQATGLATYEAGEWQLSEGDVCSPIPAPGALLGRVDGVPVPPAHETEG